MKDKKMAFEKIKKIFDEKLNKRNFWNSVENIFVTREVKNNSKEVQTRDIQKEEPEENKEKKKEEEVKENEEEKEKSKTKSEERYINLQIKLNSWSPVYEMYGIKYKEQIAKDCFDYEKRIEEQELFSYVDHDISIEKMIGATSNKSMIVSKDDNGIYAKIKVNENDSLAKKTADLIEQGVLKSNSFIFIPKEISKKFNENENINYNNNEVDLEVIYTRGELLSIDPVYKGFYPQCETSVSRNEAELILEEEMPLNEKEISVAQEDVKVESNAKTENVETVETVVKNESNEVLTKSEIEEIAEARANSTASSLIKKVLQPSLNVNFDYKEIRNKWNQKRVLTEEENEFLKSELRNLSESVTKNINLTMGVKDYSAFLEQRTIDGSNKQNGLALIEVLQNKRILKEWTQIFPELTDYAQIVPIIGLNKMEQSILIPDKTEATVLAEGAKSAKNGGKTTNVQFAPDRYSIEINQNNAINNFNELLASQTDSVKDNIRMALRKALYTNMFKNIGSNLDLDVYDGGATKEAVIETADSGKLTLADVDNVVKELISKWGDMALNSYVISMHPDVLTHLEKEYFSSGSTLWKDIYNPVERKFRGIQIIMSPYMPDKEIAGGKNAMIFYLKSSIVAYGCSFVTQDSQFEMMSEDQNARFVRTRGQIKMCDPNLNTKVLQIKA